MNCKYCNSSNHEDSPCPQRVSDVEFYVRSGLEMYPSLKNRKNECSLIECCDILHTCVAEIANDTDLTDVAMRYSAKITLAKIHLLTND